MQQNLFPKKTKQKKKNNLNWKPILIHGDCLDEMDKLIEQNIKIDAIITSPPYNISIKRKDCYYNTGYSEIDNLSEKEYISLRLKEFNLFNKLLNLNSIIIYNLSYTTYNPSLPIKLLNEIIKNTVFDVVETIAWKKPIAIPFQTSPRKLSRICEMIYVIVRKNEKHTYIANKTISKINKKTGQSFYKNYTNFIEAKNNDNIKTTHKATYSTELIEKLISIYVPVEKVILDPFMGVGTTGLAAYNTNRQLGL